MSAAVQLLRRRTHFRRLWLGSIVSQLGDWVGWVAVAMVALHDGGGPLDVALVFMAHHLPAAALAPVAGVVADRFDRRTLLWVTSIVLGLLTLGMAVAAAAGMLWLLQLLLLLRSAGVAFYTPAERATLPRVVAKDELLLAGAVDSASWSVMFAFGMAAGGALSVLGPAFALALDAGTFLVTAILFFGLPSIEPEQSDARPRLLHGVTDALAFVWPRPALRRAVFAKTPYALAGGAAWLGLALQADALGGAALGGLGFGLLHAVRGIGTGIGPIVVTQNVARGVDRVRMWRVAIWVGFVGVLGVGLLGSPWLLLAASFLWGIGGGTNWVVSTEQMQRLTPDGVLARTSALDQIGMTVAMTAGVFGLALAVDGGIDLGLGVLLVVAPATAAWWLLDRSASIVSFCFEGPYATPGPEVRRR